MSHRIQLRTDASTVIATTWEATPFADDTRGQAMVGVGDFTLHLVGGADEWHELGRLIIHAAHELERRLWAEGRLS